MGTGRVNIMNNAQQMSEIGSSSLTQLALRTLAHFDFKVCHRFNC